MTTPQIPTEVLMRFCAKDDLNDSLNSPFLLGNQLLASNRHIAIRLDQVPAELEGAPGSPRIAKKIWELIESTKTKGKPLAPLPTLPSPPACPTCHGTGENEESGYRGVCYPCDGSGELPDLPFTYTKAGPGAYIANRYLRLIAALPNPKIATDWLSVCYFTFDGGDGAVMPMRVTENDEAQPFTAV